MKKIALISGSTSGIGLEIAITLAKNNYVVILNSRKTREDIQDTLKLFTDYHYDYFQADISKSDDRKSIVEYIITKYGRVDVLINNAAIAPDKRIDMLKIEESDFLKVLKINLGGAFFMSQECSKSMIDLRNKIDNYSPRIININSISSYTSSINRASYCVAKAGLSMTTELFATRLAEYLIPVFEIRAGIIDTPMIEPVRDSYISMINQGLTPIKRLGTPQDIAKAILSLCSGNMDFGTGTAINIDGGFHIRRL